ncbi:MAG: ATP-binding protein, partial [Candidatus Omnitrophica bacterium]|nr:ATP-binding protein [Candidatus Omnitrophota bacterium]
MDKKQQEQLNHCLTELCLPVVLKQYPDLAKTAQSESLSYEEYLLSVLEIECETRRMRRIDRRLKESRLPLEKNLKTFEMSRLPK